MRLLTLLLLALLAAPLLGSCSVLGRRDPYPDLTAATAEAHLDRAEADVEAERLDAALERVVAVRRLSGLSPEARARAEGLAERVTGLLLARDAGRPGALEDLYEEDLSPRLRARLGVARARAHLERGELVKAWKTVRDVEAELPGQTDRRLAGDVVASAGLALIHDPGRYRLVLRYASSGAGALEFLVVTYPSHPKCAEAYAALADLYERRGHTDLAIDRHELLLLYCPDSPQAVRSEARLPYLRLVRLERDDNDRQELERARTEIATWLRRHPGHELEPWVRSVETECLARLAESDLVLARYYERIDVPFGARFHAERASTEARAAGDEDALAAAGALLDDLGPPPGAEDAPVAAPAQGGRGPGATSGAAAPAVAPAAAGGAR